MWKRKYLNPIKGPILNKEWGGGGFLMTSATILEACVSFTNAEWLARTKKQLVAAPGAGNYYNILQIMVVYTYGTAVASNVTLATIDYAEFEYYLAASPITSTAADSQLTLTWCGDKQISRSWNFNLPIKAWNSNAGVTGGTGATYKVCILYTIEAF